VAISSPRLSGSTAAILLIAYSLPPTDPAAEIEHAEEPSAEDKLEAQLQSYMDLPHGWDGYDGVPASLDAVTDAFSFLKKRPPDIPLPYPQIGPDGEVGLYWHTKEVFAEVGFYGDGEYSYHARYAAPEGKPVKDGGDSCPANGRWDPGLLLILNKIDR
jgi:hypothetical protein